MSTTFHFKKVVLNVGNNTCKSGSWFLILYMSVGLSKEVRPGHQTTWVPALILPASGCVASGKWLHISESW